MMSDKQTAIRYAAAADAYAARLASASPTFDGQRDLRLRLCDMREAVRLTGVST